MDKLISADALSRRFGRKPWYSADEIQDEIADAQGVDAIPVDWLTERINETARPKDDNDIELNHALFWTSVEWERWKKEHGENGR